jgi:DNA-directed RNA polymerase III subunit RPC11
MHFCPVCGNLLLLQDSNLGLQFCCPTCPYKHDFDRRYISYVKLKKKEIDDVLGESEAWENVDKTTAHCPFCTNDTAFFKQIQIRSADEPSTIFYKCTKCMGQWNDR